MTTNRVKNIIKNYKSYVSEYKLMMRRVDNNNKVLDEESYRYVQFIHISRYGHLIDTQIKSLDEIENIFYGANPSNLIERIIKDYNEIDTWLKLVKAKNPVLKKYEMNGSTHLYFSKNLNHEHSKIVLSYIAMLDSFEVFYKPILEIIPQPHQIEEKLSQKQIALIHAYTGVAITDNNKDEIAKKHGWTAKKSGHKIKLLFNKHYYRPSDRIGAESTKKKTENKIELIKSVINLLPTNKQQKAVDEIKTLKSVMDTEYL